MKDHVPQKQHAPAVGAELVHGGIGLVAGLADLAALRLVTAFPPAFLELHIVDTAPLFRVHLLGEIHGFLLEQHRQGNDRQKYHQQRNDGAADLLGQLCGAGAEKEEADNYRQAVQQQRPAQALLRPLHHVLILAVPAAEGSVGLAVLVQSKTQQHGGTGSHSPGGCGAQQVGKRRTESSMVLPEIPGHTGQTTQHTADKASHH